MRRTRRAIVAALGCTATGLLPGTTAEAGCMEVSPGPDRCENYERPVDSGVAPAVAGQGGAA